MHIRQQTFMVNGIIIKFTVLLQKELQCNRTVVCIRLADTMNPISWIKYLQTSVVPNYIANAVSNCKLTDICRLQWASSWKGADS